MAREAAAVLLVLFICVSASKEFNSFQRSRIHPVWGDKTGLKEFVHVEKHEILDQVTG